MNPFGERGASDIKGFIQQSHNQGADRSCDNLGQGSAEWLRDWANLCPSRYPYTAFGLTQDRDDLRLSVSACLHLKSPRSSCRENSTYAAPYFRGDYPVRLSGKCFLLRLKPNGSLSEQQFITVYNFSSHQIQIPPVI